MAFIRTGFVAAIMLLCMVYTKAQTVTYPLKSSQLLRSTAEDAAMLLQKAIAGSQFTVGTYTGLPQAGIIFIYDSSISKSQYCRVESDGSTFIRFSAAEDNGLCFGIYQYLHDLGYRFYQPGTAWEIIPSLQSAFKKTDTAYTTDFKYNSWSISGGHNRWVMDNSNNYGWDTYFGENGHNWALYQRRNGMNGAYRFTGHRDDVMTGSYLATLQNNPCYVASHDSTRQATLNSVPDVNNGAAMELWANTLQQKYVQYRNTILGNTTLYMDLFRNHNYNHQNIGIEVPDAAKWGNTKDNSGCSNLGYAKESDQHFTLANFTMQKISTNFPNLRSQLYAYSTHADVPSPNIQINDRIDIQLVPEVYQNLTSTNGLRNRWYNRTKNISEYNYLNLSDWSGETPAFDLNDLKNTVQIARDKKSQGLMWEASPAKFASLPFLLAVNKSLKDNTSIEANLEEFCNNMFASAAKDVLNLLKLMSNNNIMVGGTSNRYKLSVFFNIMTEAEQKIMQEPAIVKERLQELKAYLHYMVLYFDWAADQRPADVKKDKAAALCIYLAKIHKIQLVNSYFLITTISSKYPRTSNFFGQYNYVNGTAYQGGNLSLITAAEIEDNYRNDMAGLSNKVDQFKFEQVASVTDRLDGAGLETPKKINVKLNYTNGMDHYNRCEFFIKAPAKGNFTISYKPSFDMPGKGYINFTVESIDKALQIITDITLDKNAPAGSLNIALPNAGNYKITVSSKYKSAADLEIITNKNIFYKSGSFFGKATEVYADDKSMPGYFYIPAGVNRVYFSLGNSNSATGYATAEKINTAFAIQDKNGKTLTARFVTPTDSALFFIDIPAESRGKFCRITKKANYDLVFANISNHLWYAQPKSLPCSAADFTIAAINKNGRCITQLRAKANTGSFNWEVTDMGITYSFTNQKMIELPDNSSPNAMVTLMNGTNCWVTRKLSDDKDFLKAKQACASGGVLPDAAITPALYPNPSVGTFRCMQNGMELNADQVLILNAHGNKVAEFVQVKQFNINNMPSGLYWYKMLVNGAEFSGKLVKL